MFMILSRKFCESISLKNLGIQEGRDSFIDELSPKLGFVVLSS